MTVLVNRSSRIKSGLLGALGVLVLLAVWEALGRAAVFGRGWPAFTEVLQTTVNDWSILRRAAGATMWDALRGFTVGLSIGFLLATIGLLVTPLRRGIGRLATLLNSIPWIALGPLMVMVVSSAATPLVFASLAVFFSSFVAISAGFSLVSRAHHDVFTTLGATKWTRFRRLEMKAVIPSIVYAAKLGAPAAMFGVVFGEWFGTTHPGLGLVMVTSLQQFFTARLWAAAGLTALIAIGAFGFFAFVEDLVIRRDYSVREDVREAATPSVFRSGLGVRVSGWSRQIGDVLLTVWPFVIVIGFWQVAVSVWDVSPIVAPSPGSVASDIVLNPDTYLSYAGQTLLYAALGLLVGTLIGLGAALGSWLSPMLQSMLAAPMIIMYSVPLVATVPIMARVLGYTRTTVLAVAALVSMFPTFVLTSSGFRSTPAGADDVFTVLGAPRPTRLRRLAMPSAIPNFLTAVRLNAALAFVAAILGEYLTGRDGLGWLFAIAYAGLDMPRAWGAAVVIILFSVLAYIAASWVETRGQQRML